MLPSTRHHRLHIRFTCILPIRSVLFGLPLLPPLLLLLRTPLPLLRAGSSPYTPPLGTARAPLGHSGTKPVHRLLEIAVVEHQQRHKAEYRQNHNRADTREVLQNVGDGDSRMATPGRGVDPDLHVV